MYRITSSGWLTFLLTAISVKSEHCRFYLRLDSVACAAVVVITGDWALVAETVATTAGGIVLEVVTGGRDWIGWWMMCWTAGWAAAAFGNWEAGLRTVVTLELDITAAAAAPRGRWDAPMCSGGPGALLLMMDICTLVAMIWCKLLGCPCRVQEQNKSAVLTKINGHRITTSQPQRQKRDFGEIIGVPRLHALKAEWRKKEAGVCTG